MENPPIEVRIEDLLQHAGFVRKLALSLVRDANAAEDLVQDTWLAALKRPPRDAGNLRGWLARVVTNVARQRGRREAPRRAREISTHEERPTATPDELLAAVDAQRVLAEQVLNLAEPYRSTVVQRYWQGLDSTQIAELEGITPGAARWRLKRGLDKLREQLDAKHDGDRESWCLALGPLVALRPPAAALGAKAAAAFSLQGLAKSAPFQLAALLLLVFAGAWALFASGTLNSHPIRPAPLQLTDRETASSGPLAERMEVPQARVAEAPQPPTAEPDLTPLGLVAATPPPAQLTSAQEIAFRMSPDMPLQTANPEAGALFGSAVDLSGNIALIGGRSGHAFLFDTKRGRELATLSSESGKLGTNFEIEVAIDGQHALVGPIRMGTSPSLQAKKALSAKARDKLNEQVGVALFDVSDPKRPTETAILFPDEKHELPNFGAAIAIDGNTVLVGAPVNTGKGKRGSAAFLFDISDPKQPKQLAKLTSGASKKADATGRFGESVALSSGLALVGSHRLERVGVFDAATGERLASLAPKQPQAMSGFGQSVAISGTTAIVGAQLRIGEPLMALTTAAYVFDLSDPEHPVEVARITTPIAIGGNQPDGPKAKLNTPAVSLDGTLLVVGGGRDLVVPYDLSDPARPRELTYLRSPIRGECQSFGSHLAIDGDTVVIGAQTDATFNRDTGAVYAFEVRRGAPR